MFMKKSEIITIKFLIKIIITCYSYALLSSAQAHGSSV